MAELLKGKTVEKRQGSTYSKVDPATHLKGKVVGLYFSAHWCPPCRRFTSVLKDFYNKVADLPFEIIFISSDNSEDALKSYMNEAHGDWCVIPFGDPEIEALNKKYDIQGIPTLIIIKPNGDALVTDARDDVEEGKKAPVELVNEWVKKAGL